MHLVADATIHAHPGGKTAQQIDMEACCKASMLICNMEALKQTLMPSRIAMLCSVEACFLVALCLLLLYMVKGGLKS